ncbi:MAG: urea transporter, partial [Zetaproteobacteria bacterium CG02_land_8_20_14_3_00_50_9]
LAAHSYGTLSRYLLPLAPNDGLISPFVDQFLTALGSIYFIPHPVAGLLLFIAIVISSRYIALLAIAGFLCGFSTYAFLSGSPHQDLVAWNGFNFVLVAVAIGGLFTLPGIQSFLLAMAGSVMAALVTAATETFMLVYGLPVMALPFLITTLTILLALNRRPISSGLQLTLDRPMLPEKSAEQARLAIARHGEFGSVALLPPFYGRWHIYQGFNGRHTHQPPWQHALDFHIVEGDKSYRTNGGSLEDFYCFGLPVLSPVAGFVVSTLDTLPDNPPGQVDMVNNWGNHVLIRMYNGLYVLLAHLKQGSVAVEIGATIYPGHIIAQCGSSGRSPQPHLHLHVQWGAALGGATHPFHLTTVLHQSLSQSDTARFALFVRPEMGDWVMLPRVEPTLLDSLKLGVGSQLSYQVTINGFSFKRTLHVILTLDGQLRLQSDSGASAAFVLQENLLAFYQREGPADLFLDCWLLALGLTPFAEGELAWCDQPDMKLLPMRWPQRLTAMLLLPLGGGIDSSYQRHWQEDYWLQQGAHVVKLPLNRPIAATTEVHIQPGLGCRLLRLSSDVVSLEARLSQIGQQADAGIPAWKEQKS